MQTLETVMETLRASGKPSFLKTYIRHGIPADRTFGVSNADLKVIAKTIKRRQDLALELYDTGNFDAMYLAGIIVDGKKMTKEQLQHWATGTQGISTMANYSVAWPAIEHESGWDLALEWIQSNDPMVACAGWSTLSGIVTVTPDDQLDLAKVSDLLDFAVKSIDGAQDDHKSTMNTFVITVGSYVAPLHQAALSAAKRIGVLTIDHGDTDCKTKTAADAIEKMAVSGKMGVKRKTVRC